MTKHVCLTTRPREPDDGEVEAKDAVAPATPSAVQLAAHPQTSSLKNNRQASSSIISESRLTQCVCSAWFVHFAMVYLVTVTERIQKLRENAPYHECLHALQTWTGVSITSVEEIKHSTPPPRRRRKLMPYPSKLPQYHTNDSDVDRHQRSALITASQELSCLLGIPRHVSTNHLAVHEQSKAVSSGGSRSAISSMRNLFYAATGMEFPHLNQVERTMVW